MSKKQNKTIRELIQILEEAPRMGNSIDRPEGSKYIAISDTLASKLISKLNTLGVIEDQKAPRVTSIQGADIMGCGACGQHSHYIFRRGDTIVTLCTECSSESEIKFRTSLVVDWGLQGDGCLAIDPDPEFDIP